MSFTIKCDKCGNESAIIESTHEIHHYKYWKSENDSLVFDWGSTESFIKCKKCENSIKQDS